MEGETFAVKVAGANLPALGAYEVVVTYDDQALLFLYGTDEGFLGSTGRNVSCIAPVVSAGEVRFGCVTTGSGAGPSGDGTLASLHFTALAPGDSEIALRDAGLADEFGGNAGAPALRGVTVSVAGDGAPKPTETATVTPGPSPEETWEGTPQFVPPVDTPTVAPRVTNTAVPTFTSTRVAATPASGGTDVSGVATPPGGSLLSEDSTPSSNVAGASRAQAGIALPSTGSAGLLDQP
jgi:hypothetical protein